LVLKVFFRADYRGVTAFLAEWSDLRAALAPDRVPPFTTLQKPAEPGTGAVAVAHLPKGHGLLRTPAIG
jgi:hypothetical protein